MTNSIHDFTVILLSVFMIHDSWFAISIHDSVKKNINGFEYLCLRRFIKKILTNQNECTQMKVDFKWLEKKDENKYAKIKNR